MAPKPIHDWLRTLSLAYVPGPLTPLLEHVSEELLKHFRLLGHRVQALPDSTTDLIITTAPFGEPLDWRQALLFTARRRFKLPKTPMILSLIHACPNQLYPVLAHLERALARSAPDPLDYACFPGLAPQAYKTLHHQGQRGGPILALERILQAQAKSIRILLVVGEDRPLYAYHFDLVGAHPRTDAASNFYQEIVLRLVTAASARELTDHLVLDEVIPRALWEQVSTPKAMCRAGAEFGQRHFFTEMVRIEQLVSVPAVGGAVASQYSEGCFATWEPQLNALLTTITGSARPVDKAHLSQDDLAVVVGVRPDGRGAIVRPVEGQRNDPPSSEAVEMFQMDSPLPKIKLPGAENAEVPVIRSKLHSHRGIAAYDPTRVEFVPLDPPYYHYLVSCATDAQARAVTSAFARAHALQNPHDPRQVVFTVLPGHGVVLAEKWSPNKAPFQTIWEYMDAGYLEVSNYIPQGPMHYAPGRDGRWSVRESTE
ncbi:MAG: hypothetical protein N3E42_02765 [Candidatus Bipolaricaulota bacterium]|nr:hypothetical protein [Candidatus Bipolaricaulota bacterium]